MGDMLKSSNVFDVTQCVLAVLVFGVTGVLMIMGKPIEPAWVAFVGTVMGFYFGRGHGSRS